MGALLDERGLEERVRRLAALRRASASLGERQAAELLAAELRELSLPVALERERVHGTYWWPLGILSALTLGAAALPGRRLPAAAAALVSAAVADELWPGPRLFRRLALPRRETTNVQARAGLADAPTIVVHAHHDAAHTGLIFHPALRRGVGGRLAARLGTTPPLYWAVAAPPLLATLGALLGSRRLRAAAAAGAALDLLVLADAGRSAVVPGANDNLAGVAVLLSLAHALAAEPPRRTRVLLLSTGSEESLLEGMQAWLRRHRAGLGRERTVFICLEALGSERLVAVDGEGMLRLHRYPPEPHATLLACAAELGIEVEPRFHFRFPTDGEIPRLAGYRGTVLASLDHGRLLRDYHWATTRPSGSTTARWPRRHGWSSPCCDGWTAPQTPARSPVEAPTGS